MINHQRLMKPEIAGLTGITFLSLKSQKLLRIFKNSIPGQEELDFFNHTFPEHILNNLMLSWNWA